MASTVSTLMSRVKTLYLYLAQAALIIHDDLSKQAVAYRQLSLLRRRRPLSYFIDLVKIVNFAGSLKLYLAHYREATTFAQFGSDPFLQKPSYFMLPILRSLTMTRSCTGRRCVVFFYCMPFLSLLPRPPLFTSSYFCLILASRSGHRDSPPSRADSSMWNAPILTCSFSSMRCTTGSVVSSLYHFKDSEQRCWLLRLSGSQRASRGFISPRLAYSK